MKRLATNLPHRRGIGGAPTNCRRLRHDDHKNRRPGIVGGVGATRPVSRDIVSPHKTIRGMNKSIPRMKSTGIEYPL